MKNLENEVYGIELNVKQLHKIQKHVEHAFYDHR